MLIICALGELLIMLPLAGPGMVTSLPLVRMIAFPPSVKTVAAPVNSIWPKIVPAARSLFGVGRRPEPSSKNRRSFADGALRLDQLAPSLQLSPVPLWPVQVLVAAEALAARNKAKVEVRTVDRTVWEGPCAEVFFIRGDLGMRLQHGFT